MPDGSPSRNTAIPDSWKITERCGPGFFSDDADTDLRKVPVLELSLFIPIELGLDA